MEITQENINSLNTLFDTIKKNIPSIDSRKDYWLVRAQKGLFYKSFLKGGYIAIGWNHITLEDLENLDEDAVKEK